jgi:hypothetical protein
MQLMLLGEETFPCRVPFLLARHKRLATGENVTRVLLGGTLQTTILRNRIWSTDKNERAAETRWTAPDFAPTACIWRLLVLTADNARLICKRLKI